MWNVPVRSAMEDSDDPCGVPRTGKTQPIHGLLPLLVSSANHTSLSNPMTSMTPFCQLFCYNSVSYGLSAYERYPWVISVRASSVRATYCMFHPLHDADILKYPSPNPTHPPVVLPTFYWLVTLLTYRLQISWSPILRTTPADLISDFLMVSPPDFGTPRPHSIHAGAGWSIQE